MHNSITELWVFRRDGRKADDRGPSDLLGCGPDGLRGWCDCRDGRRDRHGGDGRARLRAHAVRRRLLRDEGTSKRSCTVVPEPW